MTRSDILFERMDTGDMIEKSNMSKKDKDKSQNYLSESFSYLDNLWLYMLKLDKTIDGMSDKDDNVITKLSTDLLRKVRDDILNIFEEKDFFEDDK